MEKECFVCCALPHQSWPPGIQAKYATEGQKFNCRYCKQGFEDTLRFLQSRYLISCTRCLGEASSYQTGRLLCHSHQNELLLEEELPLSAVSCVEFDPKCGDCVQQRREANADNLPLCVLEVHLSFIWLSSNAKIFRC